MLAVSSQKVPYLPDFATALMMHWNLLLSNGSPGSGTMWTIKLDSNLVYKALHPGRFATASVLAFSSQKGAYQPDFVVCA